MVSRRNERVSAELAFSIPSITVAETQEVVEGADVVGTNGVSIRVEAHLA